MARGEGRAAFVARRKGAALLERELPICGHRSVSAPARLPVGRPPERLATGSFGDRPRRAPRLEGGEQEVEKPTVEVVGKGLCLEQLVEQQPVAECLDREAELCGVEWQIDA